ncbi:MAG: hypothetical protein KAG96_08175 [Ichthyobacteriaceae bacterium]|nr:hypothetical protein [Ichthyobacteriaceae bacterium]
MEKWRIYMIMAGIIMVVFNVQNIDFSNITLYLNSAIGAFFSLVFVVLLIVMRKK